LTELKAMAVSTISVLARIIVAVSAACILVPSLSWGAERYPSKPVRIIVPFPAGGPNDVIARVIAQKLTDAWGTNVIVDNRAGAGGNIGTELVAKAVADGYTLGLVSTAFVVNPSLYASVSYHPLKDFAPVTLAAVSPVIIVAHPSFPARDVRELVQLAKKTSLNYASPGAGTTGHLGGELLNAVAGINMQHVPYKGAAPAVTDLLGGQVKLGFTAVPPAAPHVKAGRLRAIAVTTAKRTASLPDVPTVSESGFSNYEVDNMYGVIATAGTPRPVIEQLNREIARIVKAPDVKERLEGLGFDPIGNDQEAFAQYLRAESVKWAKVVKQSGARVE
jgi:tripartite-type tricarboxylate transporter receptor subunit TctC